MSGFNSPVKFARGTLLSTLVGLLVAGMLPAAAAENSLPRTLARLEQRIANNLPPRAAIEVINSETGELVYSQNAARPLLPASTMKLITAVVALETMGTTTHFTTRAFYDVAGNAVYIAGSADPMFSIGDTYSLAHKVAASVGRKRVSFYTDVNLLPPPTPAPGWQKSYVPGEVSPISPLWIRGHNTRTPVPDFANTFRKALRANGVRATYLGNRETRGEQIATIDSPRMKRLVREMLSESDNNTAERLFRLNALHAGRDGSWRSARSYAVEVLTNLGVDITGLEVVDGSGLSRANRATAATLAGLLALARSKEHPELRQLLGSHMLAVAGKTGTLRYRFGDPKHKCAVGKVDAKTGSLKDVSNLAGYVTAGDQTFAFAIIVNELRPRQMSSIRHQTDLVVAALAGC